jgi:hypothetical protein
MVAVLLAALALGGLACRSDWDHPGTRKLRARYLLLLGYLGVYFAIYLSSGLVEGDAWHWIYYLRLMPVWFLAIVLASAAIGWAVTRSSEHWRSAGRIARALALASGCAAWIDMIVAGRPLRPLRNLRLIATTKGYDYVEYFDKFVRHLDGIYDERIQVLQRFDEPAPELLYSSITWSVFEHSELRGLDVIDTLKRAFGDRFEDAVPGLGGYLYRKAGYDIPNAIRLVGGNAVEYERPLVRAIGRYGLGPRITPPILTAEIAIPVDERWRADYLHGIGYRIYKFYRLRQDRALDFMRNQGIEDGLLLWRGYEAARREHTLE